MQIAGTSSARSNMFWSKSTATPIHAPAATALRSTPSRLGEKARPKATKAASVTGTPHSEAHCAGKFSACVKTRLPGTRR
jgi:hypothetical protein